MLVREVRKISNRKAKVLFEDGSSFVLYHGEIREYGIREQEDLPEETARLIREEILKKRSRLRCMNLLKTSDHTVRELRQRLSLDEYPEDIIEQALEYVASFHYTDDGRYARNYIRQMSSKKSFRQIECELLRKGVDRETVRAAFSEQEEQCADMEAETVRSIVRKRGFDADTADLQERAKLQRYLLGRGFGYEVIRDVLGCVD